MLADAPKKTLEVKHKKNLLLGTVVKLDQKWNASSKMPRFKMVIYEAIFIPLNSLQKSLMHRSKSKHLEKQRVCVFVEEWKLKMS